MITQTTLTCLENVDINKGSFIPEDGKNKGEEILYSNIKAFCRDVSGEVCLLILKNLSSQGIDSVVMGDQFKVTLPLENVREEKAQGKKFKSVNIDFKKMEGLEFEHIQKK